MGPSKPHGGERNAVAGWGWVGGLACVAEDLAPLAGQTPAGPGGDSLDNPRHTNLDEII
jgi:hypothetical protein